MATQTIRWLDDRCCDPEQLAANDEAAAALQLLSRSADGLLPEQFLPEALATWARMVPTVSAALVEARAGQWQTVATFGPRSSLPEPLLGEVLDRGAAGLCGPWLAAPMHRHHLNEGEVLLLQLATPPPGDEPLHRVLRLLSAFGKACRTARTAHRRQRRLHELETLLEITRRWNRAGSMEKLLHDMAEAATRLLHADRASIFLWDKANATLVARPALGVQGGELRIPDDRGIVGQVVHSGQPRRVDRNRDQEQINRQIDRQLQYHTQTLLCVPLRGANDEVLGVFEMINKLDGNFTDEDEALLVELAAHAVTALENTQQLQNLLDTTRRMAEQAAEEVQLVGCSGAIEALRATLRRVADTDLAVLLLGENGTGKEVVSRMIHYHSRRRHKPFVAVNCAALTETLLESELFGHEKGAFTDAHEARPGKFELASGGTLFLDEIGDLSPAGQAKLLRVLEEKVIVRVGGSRPIHTDVRVLAATNQPLAQRVREKRFREDLYFRLNVVTLELPPLRQRGEDILLLAEHFLHHFCRHARRSPPRFTAAARARLLEHDWPGNVRELRNLMERLAYLSHGDTIDVNDFSFTLAPRGEPAGGPWSCDLPLAAATDRFQADYIREAIRANGGNMSAAAAMLGLHRSNLYRKMRQLGMAASVLPE